MIKGGWDIQEYKTQHQLGKKDSARKRYYEIQKWNDCDDGLRLLGDLLSLTISVNLPCSGTRYLNHNPRARLRTRPNSIAGIPRLSTFLHILQ